MRLQVDIGNFFLMLAVFWRTTFLTTFYGLYFSHHYTYYKLQSFSHVGPLCAVLGSHALALAAIACFVCAPF